MKKLTPAKMTMMMFGFIALLVVAYIGKRMFASTEAPPRPVTRNVPMALANLEPGTMITEADIGMGPVRASELESNVLLGRDAIIGRIVKEPISSAVPIKTSDLYKRGETPPLVMEPGMQAVTIPIGDRTDIVNGLIKPRDFVDVLLTPTVLSGDDRLENGMTMTLFKGVRVLTINRNFQSSDVSSSGNSVTLELSPEQARVITLAQQSGTLKLVFNPEGRGDGSVVAGKYSDRVTVDEILGLPPKKEPEPEPDPEPPFVTEHFRRGDRDVFRFREGIRIGNGYTDPGTRDLLNQNRNAPSNPGNDPVDSPNIPLSTPGNGPSV